MGKSLTRKHVAYGSSLPILKAGIKMLNDNKKRGILLVLVLWARALGTGWSPQGPSHGQLQSPKQAVLQVPQHLT